MKAWKVMLAVTAAALVGGPATASAREDAPLDDVQSIAGTALSCTTPVIENPFLPFGDDLDYVLAPNGSFESDAGWRLADGAERILGDDPFDLRDPDESMLSLPEGAEATSALMCVDPGYPSFRFPVRATGERATIRVEVAYPWSSWDGFRRSDSFRVSGDEGWTLSPHLDLDPDRGGTGPGWRPMAVRLIAKRGWGDAGAELDDVYVDPRMKG